MNIKEIKDMISLMNENGISEFEMEKEGFKIKLKKGPGGDIVVQNQSVPYVVEAPRAGAAPAPAAPPADVQQEAAAEDPNIEIMKSPMVGTFYMSPAPDADPFVKVGDTISPDETVCIIESMKLMNEIKAELKGTIVEILVENGQSVEFDQPLFKIKKG